MGQIGENLRKHIQLLSTVDEIREGIMKPKTGTIVYYENDNVYGEIGKVVTPTQFSVNWTDGWEGLMDENEIEIIGQVSSRHLRWFMEKKRNRLFNYTIYSDGEITKVDNHGFDDFFEIQLDNTKPYMEQGEEFFGKINSFLISEFGLETKVGKDTD